MNNIWSSNKTVNYTICVLLFLLAINIFHYGQFLLPIICLILFIDNKYKFKVNNTKAFIVLCLFSISFFIFSYKQGFYSVMGFCLPMAYYVGSNIKDNSEGGIKKTIYLIAFGMIVHVLLNFIVEIERNGLHLFASSSHYDFWISGKVGSTITTINCIPAIGFSYYLFKYEKNKYIKYGFLISLAIFIIYNLGLGQRTVYLMIIISLLFSYVLDIKLTKSKVNKKAILILVAIILVLTLTVTYLITAEIIDIYFIMDYVRVLKKFVLHGVGTTRLDIFFKTIKLAPYHLFGNREISTLMGIMPHDLWTDVYDWGGIVTFVLFVIHTVMFIKVFIKLIKNKNVSNKFKVFIIPIFVCIIVQCMLEPIMSGVSLFLVVVIIFESMIEKMIIYGK